MAVGGGAAADAFELVLADGRRLGHRSLRTYYRQKFAPAAQSWTLRLRQSQRVLEAKLAVRAAARERYKLLLRGTAVAKGLHSKALAAQFVFKASFADNKHARALQHHGYGGFGGGAHYTMAGSKQFQRGVRIKGVVSRHSKQAAKRNGLKMRQQAARRD
jgi:pre-60S factor REI1